MKIYWIQYFFLLNIENFISVCIFLPITNQIYTTSSLRYHSHIFSTYHFILKRQLNLLYKARIDHLFSTNYLSEIHKASSCHDLDNLEKLIRSFFRFGLFSSRKVSALDEINFTQLRLNSLHFISKGCLRISNTLYNLFWNFTRGGDKSLCLRHGRQKIILMRDSLDVPEGFSTGRSLYFSLIR